MITIDSLWLVQIVTAGRNSMEQPAESKKYAKCGACSTIEYIHRCNMLVLCNYWLLPVAGSNCSCPAHSSHIANTTTHKALSNVFLPTAQTLQNNSHISNMLLFQAFIDQILFTPSLYYWTMCHASHFPLTSSFILLLFLPRYSLPFIHISAFSFGLHFFTLFHSALSRTSCY